MVGIGGDSAQNNALKIHSFVLCHTNSLFCPWAYEQSPLFTQVIVTGGCVCWQSIGGFGHKALTQFDETFIVCVWMRLVHAPGHVLLHCLQPERWRTLIPFSGSDSALTLRSGLWQSCSCESMWQQYMEPFKLKSSVGVQNTQECTLWGLQIV